MAKKSDNKIKNAAVSRYGWVVVFLFLIFVAVTVSIFKIKYVEGSMWRELGRQQVKKKDREIRPDRGNIYSDDGRLLATSQPLYGIYIDFLSEGIREDSLMKHVTPLSQALANKFPSRSAATYKKIMLDGWALSRKEAAQIAQNKKNGSKKKVKTRSRYVRLIANDVSYLDLKEIQTFPFLNQRSNRSGMIAEERTMRLKPFGNLAGRTIGSIYKGFEMGGTAGLELKYDSIMKGVPGVKSRQRVQGRWIDVVEIEPEAGWDINTTLNIEIQDITERALIDKLVETSADAGCAVIMEVETGEIKAVVNLDRTAGGYYAEGNPHVFSYMGEPGSTFKTVSLMVALEDGVATPDEQFQVGDGVFPYKGRLVRDHYWRHGGRQEYMTVTEGMYISSNVVLSKMILKGYENNPRKFVEGIEKIGLTKNLEWDVPLSGKEGTVNIRYPDNKANPWSKTTLPWMSFGYETQVPPIYMLMFYNGIANNGKMIKPFLTRSFTQDGSVKKKFKPEVVNSSIASSKTLEQVQEILRGVVEGERTTGKPVRSNLFPIAGKTGTALIASGGSYNSGYYVSFCGYFPADKPKYTIYVGIRRPKGVPSGGLMPGAVFKKIAESVHFKDLASKPIKAPVDTLHALSPLVKRGRYKDTKLVLGKLKQKYVSPSGDGEWVNANIATGELVLDAEEARINGLVPNVVGMGARDAVYVLENAGLKVNMQGAGRVTKQTLNAGTRIVRGSTIGIQLN